MSGEMNICLITPRYPPDTGGLAVAARRLAQGVARSGHNMQVCVAGKSVAPGKVESKTEAPRLSVHRVGARPHPADTLADCFNLLAKLHAQRPFDALHGYYLGEPAFVTVYAGRFLGVPAVVSARGQDLDRAVFDPQQAAPILWALEHADFVTAVSSDLAQRARALAPAATVRVIFNGVDTRRFAPAPRNTALARKLGLADGPTAAFVGVARREKGLSVLLKAFARVRHRWQNNPPPQFLLIGGARQEEAAELQAFIAQFPDFPLRVIPYVEQGELPDYYNLVDALVLPSLQDGLPNALLEGMACARAIVASDIGGIPDALHHGENGLLVSPGNAEALAAAIRRLLLEPDYRAALGRAARQTVLQKFTPERELAENLAVYRRFYPKPAELSGASSTAETASVISGAAPSALLKSMVIGSSPSPGSMTTSREMERRSAMGPSISTRPRM